MKRTDKISDGEFWADKLMDLANLSAIVLIFSQLVSINIYWISLIIGIIFYLLIVLTSYKLRKKG